jgi:nucleotide-binding universal stress UspA family protein
MAATKFKKILAPLDGSKNSLRGLDMAIILARQSQAVITGICIIPGPPHPAFGSARAVRYPEKEMLVEAEKTLEFAERRCAENGILFQKKIRFGDPGHAIVKSAKEGKFDIIVIGIRGRGVVKEMFFGSVSNYVVHKSDVPVLVVK